MVNTLNENALTSIQNITTFLSEVLRGLIKVVFLLLIFLGFDKFKEKLSATLTTCLEKLEFLLREVS